MGQYYKPVNIEKKQYLISYNYHNGAKLMEHSYLTNSLVSAVEQMLIPTGKWHKDRIAWCGDYADTIVDARSGVDTNVNIYDMCNAECDCNVGNEWKKIFPFPDQKGKRLKRYRWLVNHTKKEVVDRNKEMTGVFGLKINPLPLLTADGNGRGGGDYRGNDEKHVGRWRFDSISLETKKPEGFIEIELNFSEK